jgi:hypothetical protein
MVGGLVTRGALWTVLLSIAVAASGAACAARPLARVPGAAAPRAIAPGAPAPFSYHFDRNALAASVRTAGGELLALTDTGDLLLFDDQTLALRGERVPRVPVVCLGPAGAAGVTVGLEDGRVVVVELPSLGMKPAGAVDGTPAWIGRAPSGALLVAHGLVPEKPLGWRAAGVQSLLLEELGTGRTLRLPFVGQAFLAGRDGRLWIGADSGEWCGRLAVVDLKSWSVRELDIGGARGAHPQGVYGFTETPDGHVWAYGGTVHMGARGSFIMAVDQEPPARLLELGFARAARPDRPSLPITHVVPVGDGRMLVFAYDQLFETDAQLASWRRLPKLAARYRSGRPDAIGNGPAVKSVHLLGASPRRLAIATARDGWVELRDEAFTAHALAGQLGNVEVTRFDDWAGRIVARGDSPDEGAWVLAPQGDGWRPIEASPPVALPESARNGWTPGARFLPRPDGKLLAAFRDEPGHWRTGKPALLVTALCSDGRCDVLGNEQSLLHPKDMFMAPDGGAWGLDEFGLWRLGDGRWVLAAPRGGEGQRSPLPELDGVAAVVPTSQPPWILHAQTALALLSPGTKDAPPRLTVPPGQPPADPLRRWLDVTSCGGRVAVARGGGVCALDVATGACAPIPLDASVAVDHVGCDREGRLWLGGRGLWVVDGGAVTPVHELDALVGAREIRALGRDTGAGLPVAIERRGVAVLFPPAPGRGLARHGAGDEGDRASTPPARQAVFVLYRPGRDRELVTLLDEALVAAKAGRFAGFVEHPTLGPRLVFYGPSAGKMVGIMRGALDQRGRKATLFRRDGAVGAPEERIEVPGEKRR